MQYVSTTDAEIGLDALVDAAQREPIVIRREEQEVAVLVSQEEYRRLRGLRIAEFQAFCDRVAADAAARGLTEETLATILGERD